MDIFHAEISFNWMGYRMNKLLLLYTILIASQTSASGYDDGQSFGLSKPVVVGERLLQDVPQYNASTKDRYADLNDAKLKQKARDAAKNSDAVNTLNSSRRGDKNNYALSPTDLTNSSGISVCNNNRCTPKSPNPANDFSKAVTELKSLEAATQDFQHLELSFIKYYAIFSGEKKQCSQAWLGYNNCCKDNGWGQDIHLAGCNSEEKELGKLKEKVVCHYVGEYCAKKVKTPLGSQCQQTKQSYCCFHSKLSRVVMDAAHVQLKLSWGNAENPHCEGLKPEQLQQVDFDKIDFSEYFADLKQQTANKNNQELKKILIEKRDSK